MEELKTKLIELCNNSKLPLEPVYFVVKDLYRDLQEMITVARKQQEADAKQNEAPTIEEVKE